MPTGYTYEIYDGKEVSGVDFIKRCARAFGAYVMVRDEPLDKEVPDHFEANSYGKEHLLKAHEELQKYYSMSLDEAQKEADKQFERMVVYNKEQIDMKKKLKARYQRVLDEVEMWNPPTEEHVNLKNYCIEQLKTSIDNDCDISYYGGVKHQTGQEWLDDMIASCLRDIKYYSEEQANEDQRTKERNEWIRQLKDSLERL